MELKGKAVENISAEKREKMIRTLERMERTRRNDDMFLRDVIKGKLDWSIEEREKGYKMIDTLKRRLEEITLDTNKRVEEIEKQILKLEGIILVLQELNEIQPEKEEEPKTNSKKETKSKTNKKSAKKKITKKGGSKK